MILRKSHLTSILLRQTLGWTDVTMQSSLRSIASVSSRHLHTSLLKFTTNSDLNYARTRGSSCTCQGQGLIFFSTQALSFKELCILKKILKNMNIRVLKDCKLFETALRKYDIPICRFLHFYFLIFELALSI